MFTPTGIFLLEDEGAFSSHPHKFFTSFPFIGMSTCAAETIKVSATGYDALSRRVFGAPAGVKELHYVPYRRTNIVNVGAAHKLSVYGDDYYCRLVDALLPGVLVVAIYVKPQNFEPYLHEEALAYYDAEAQELHIGARPEDVGVSVSDLTDFKEAGDGADDTARVILLDFDDCGEVFGCPEATPPGYKSAQAGLHARMHADYATQSSEERAHNAGLFTALIERSLDYSENIDDDEFTAENLKAELDNLHDLEALWPNAFNAAYANRVRDRESKVYPIGLGSVFKPYFDFDTREPILTFHVEHLAPFLNAEDVARVQTRFAYTPDDPTHEREIFEPVYERFREHFAWPSSKRCSWIVACLQLGFSAEEEAQAQAQAQTAQKRRAVLI